MMRRSASLARDVVSAAAGWRTWCAWVVALCMAASLGAPALGGDATPEQELAAARARLERMVGADTLAAIRKEEGGADFVDWLLSSQEAMDAFTTTPPVPQDPAACLRVWRAIDKDDPADREGLLFRLAVATALEHGTPVIPWSEWGDAKAAPIDPVKRYHFYRQAYQNNVLFPGFERLPLWEVRRVVDIPLYDEDVAWFHASLPKPEIRNQDRIGEAMWLVKYQERNPANGHSVHEGKAYYDGKRWTPAVILEYGGVCGAVSKFGSFAARAFGVPAQPLGQEGHCAMTWKQATKGWVTGNCGKDAFAWSNLHGIWPGFTGRGTAIPLYAAIAERPEFVQSFHAVERAGAGAQAPKARRDAKRAALESTCPANYTLWRELVTDACADPALTQQEALALATGAMRGMATLAPQMALDLAIALEQTPMWRALRQPERTRWNEALQEQFLAARSGAVASNAEQGAWQELMARALWEQMGEVRGFGDFPLLEHLAILQGKNNKALEWWKNADTASRRKVAERLRAAGKRAGSVPALASITAQALSTWCAPEPALRSLAADALLDAADACRKAGQNAQALAIYRAAILQGEKMGDRDWVVRFTAAAKKNGASSVTIGSPCPPLRSNQPWPVPQTQPALIASR